MKDGVDSEPGQWSSLHLSLALVNGLLPGKWMVVRPSKIGQILQ